MGYATVRNADPPKLIAVILDGIAAQHFGAKENTQSTAIICPLSCCVGDCPA